VENLETNVEDENLKNYFQQFGQVCYISLPKFKTSKQMKGFAFIEFSDESEAKAAVKFFEPFFADENEKKLIGKFPRFNSQIVDLETKIHRVLETIEYEQPLTIINEPNQKGSKRCLDTTDQDQDDSKEQTKKTKQFTLENDYTRLRVVSKKKWLKLKEAYLSKQKSDLNDLKQKLLNLTAQLDKIRMEKVLPPTNTLIKTDDIVKGCIVKLLVDLTLNSKEEEEEAFKMTRQKFRDTFLVSFSDQVVYVDVQKSSGRIFLRCKSPQVARTLLDNSEFLPRFKKSLLVNEEEMDYFKKIYQNRGKKLDKKR
jgi:RNA recognition motif-containing protein